MSREFGSYAQGYFHHQIETAASDLSAGSDELSRVWSRFFVEFAPIAYAIASSEACDSGKDYPIMETIEGLPKLKEALAAVESYVAPFKAVAEQAIRETIKARG